MDKKSPELRTILHSQTRLLDALIHLLVETKNGDHPEEISRVLDVTLLMIQSLGVSSHSILKLTSDIDMSIRDCFSIARSINELSINICYITCAGEDAASRASRHALQKTYRNFDRGGTIGGINFRINRDNIPDPKEIPGMVDALAEFTRKNGQEVRDWSNVDLSGRISKVSEFNKAAGMALAGATISIYRNSSELLHGTYFGVLYFWTGSLSAKISSREEFEKLWEDHFISMYSVIFFSIDAVIELYTSIMKEKYIREEMKKLIRLSFSIVHGDINYTDIERK